jgi:hypothetical protein
MKRILSTVAVVAVLAVSCNPAPEARVQSQQTIMPNTDTIGLAQFQQWKAQNELMAMAQFQAAAQAAQAPQQRTVVYVPQRTASAGSGRAVSSSSNTAKAAQKKGWSKAAKGAVIGGVAGAAGGAIINKKNRAVGAVIGGVIGAAGGYGIGRGMDKRDGRIQYASLR